MAAAERAAGSFSQNNKHCSEISTQRNANAEPLPKVVVVVVGLRRRLVNTEKVANVGRHC